ncbi:hypothetical protein RvY_05708 [Ramazzottius varieornatus]|uniref:Dihydropteridine reductase n=1 Tax=Ramazzottius varieornatus TaxID=947166 RepID=A0A1D1UVY8_RAMVA|nr:hypothetical protein RvY_05708 [Ramazzottius varieornatus]
MAATSARRVLVYGGRGALGATVVKHFKAQGYWVGSLDFANNEDANGNVSITKSESLLEQEQEIVSGVKSLLGDSKLDCLVCVAGGWAGGNAAAEDFIKNTDLVLKQSVWSSAIASRLASLFLRPGGLLTLTGARPALEGTPGMIGYGMAKAAVHQLVRSLAATNSGLPEGVAAVAILPTTLDTPMNRKWMPKADTSSWTPMEYVAEMLHKWVENQDRPASGSLVSLITANGQTKLEFS